MLLKDLNKTVFFSFTLCLVFNIYGQSSDLSLLLVSSRQEFESKNITAALSSAKQGLYEAQLAKDIEYQINFNLLLGEIYASQKNFPQAISSFVFNIHTLESNSLFFNYLGESYYGLAKLFMQMKAYNQAERCLKSAFTNYAIVNDPAGKLKTQMALGLTLYELQKYERASAVYAVLLDSIPYYSKSISLKYTIVEQYLNVLDQLGNYKEGMQIINQYLEDFPKSGISGSRFTEKSLMFYFKTGQFEDLENVSNELLKKQSSNLEVQFYLAKVYIQNRQYTIANSVLERLLYQAGVREDYIKIIEGLNLRAEVKIIQDQSEDAVLILKEAEKMGLEKNIYRPLITTYELLVEASMDLDRQDEVVKYQFLLRSAKRRINEENAQYLNDIKVSDNLAARFERQYRQEAADLLRRQMNTSRRNVTEQESEIQEENGNEQEDDEFIDIERQQVEQTGLQQNLRLTKQLLAQQQAGIENLSSSRDTEIDALRELENEQLLELSRKEKMILQQQYELQQTQYRAADQRQKLFIMLIIVSLIVVLVLIFLVLRIKNFNRIISDQNRHLEQQKEELKLAQVEITKTLENEQKFRKGLQHTNKELKDTQAQLIHAEKMSSLGQLTAGLFHEINNPVNFVKGGIETLDRSLQEIIKLLDEVAKIKYRPDVDDQYYNQLRGRILDQLEYAKDVVPQIIKDMLFGTKRIEEIIDGLRIFSRQSESKSEFVKLHEVINSALLLLQRKIENVAIIHKSFDTKIEKIECFPGQLNQVLVNLVSNSLDAMVQGDIYIKTEDLGDTVSISVKDNGVGMNKETIQHIFEPFFTTKEVGKGTGLGLSISYSIIDKHQGSIKVYSEAGKGTEFIVTLKKVLEKKPSVIKKVSEDLMKK